MGRNQAGRPGLSSSAPRTTQLCARTVAARLGQRAVYSWKVQVPQTSWLLRWTLVSSTAATWSPCQIRPGACSTKRVRLRVTAGASQAPYSAKDSIAFQSAGRSRASTDWVMVCSSTLRARAVTHSTKRRNPDRVKAQWKGQSSACQMDQRSVASVIGTSPSGARWESDHPAGSARPMPCSIGYRGSVRVEDFGETTAYLLRGVKIERPDQVWSADITYVPMPSGFMYLAAVIDWYSRYVITWRLSNTLDGSFCLEMLDEALRSGKPEVFNTDQGVQFTAEAFTGCLERAGVAVSMDGRGRALDNVFVERLWRSVKYEDISIRGYEAVPELHHGLVRYFGFYNDERLHQSLGYRTPAAVYREVRSMRA